MIEIWYGILSFVLIVYVVLDGRNFGAGILHLVVAKTPAERRQLIAAIGPLWSWDEVWLVAFGGTMFVAFPRLLATAFFRLLSGPLSRPVVIDSSRHFFGGRRACQGLDVAVFLGLCISSV